MYFRLRTKMDRFYVVEGESVRCVCRLRDGQLERVDSPAYELLDIRFYSMRGIHELTFYKTGSIKDQTAQEVWRPEQIQELENFLH
jgi:hypothetical protein